MLSDIYCTKEREAKNKRNEDMNGLEVDQEGNQEREMRERRRELSAQG